MEPLFEESIIVRRQDAETYVAAGNDRSFTDSSAAAVLQKAVDWLPRLGGEIYIAPGLYVIESSIEIDRPVLFHGAGAGATGVKQNMTLFVASDEFTGAVIEVTGANSVVGDSPVDRWNGFMQGTKIADFGIIHSGKSDPEADCIRISARDDAQLANYHVERLSLRNAGNCGVHFAESAKQHQLRDIWATHCQGAGIGINSGKRYWLTNCYCYASGRGVHVSTEASDITVTAPHCRQNIGSGLFIEADSFQVIGGRMISNGEHGVVVGNNATGVVSGMEVLNNERHGIQIGITESEQTSGVRLLGNWIGNGGTQERFGIRQYPSTNSKEESVNLGKLFYQKLREEGVSRTLVSSGRYLWNRYNGTEEKKLHSQQNGVVIRPGVSDTTLLANHIVANRDQAVADHGTRTRIDGLGTNAGDPSVEGEWHGAGTEGVDVFDTETESLYKFARGKWRKYA